MIVTTIIEWDMGHRIPNHKSKCRNLHGHRYKLEVNMEGGIIRKSQDSSESMVMDFGDIKDIVRKEIADRCDHAFMYWEKDKDIKSFFKRHPAYKNVCVPFVPTAEEIVRWIFVRLKNKFKDIYKTELHLHSLVLWETPNSKAYCSEEDTIHDQHA